MEDQKNTAIAQDVAQATTSTVAAQEVAQASATKTDPNTHFITIDQLRKAHTDPIYFAFKERHKSDLALAERIWWIAGFGSFEVKCVVSGRNFPSKEVTVFKCYGGVRISYGTRSYADERLIFQSASGPLRPKASIMDLDAFKKCEQDWKYVRRAQIRAKGEVDLAIVSQLIESRMYCDQATVDAFWVYAGQCINEDLFSLNADRAPLVGVDLGKVEVTKHRLGEIRDYYGQYAVAPIELRFETRDDATVVLAVKFPK